jgi:hypothetical protein
MVRSLILMKTLLRSVCLVALAGVLAAPLMAAEGDAGAKKKKGERPQRNAAKSMFRLPDSIALSEEQQARVDALAKEYAPKLAEVRKKADAVLTDEQRQALKDAITAARESGKKGQEFREAVKGTVQLSDAQKQAQQDVRDETKKLLDEARGKLDEILTADQKEQLKKAREERRPRKGEGAPKQPAKPKKPAA